MVMRQDRLAFDFNCHACEKCLNLDYEQDDLDESWSRKRPTPARGKYPLEVIPNNLVKKTLEKMNQQGFSRMRRTRKWISSFIHDNRAKMKIPMFHNFKIVFGPNQNRDDIEVGFVYPPLVICEPMNYDFYDGRDEDKHEALFGNLDDFETTDFDKFSGIIKRVKIHNEPAVAISLKAWKNIPDLQDELTGVYHGNSIDCGSFQTVEEIQLICEFMQFAGLTGKKLKVEDCPDLCLQVLCKTVKPFGLCSNNGRHQKDLFQQEGFESIKEIILDDCPFTSVPTISDMPHLEKFQVYSYGEANYANIFKTIEKWRSGTISLNELFICGYGTEIDVTKLPGRITLSKEETENVVGPFINRNHCENPEHCGCDAGPAQRANEDCYCFLLTSGGMMIKYNGYWEDVCILKCEPLNKTAFCFYSGLSDDIFYFNVI